MSTDLHQPALLMFILAKGALQQADLQHLIAASLQRPSFATFTPSHS